MVYLAHALCRAAVLKHIAFILLLSLFSFSNQSSLPTHPFGYDLRLCSIPGTNSRTMICFHGMGGNYQIAQILKNLDLIDATVVGFNFPDHDLQEEDLPRATFGTIAELLPAFYVLKSYILDQGLESIDLYGFSAGGGALINLIAILNTSEYDIHLQRMGIGSQEKKTLLNAIQKGIVILDAPLKSIEEIIDLRGTSPGLNKLAQNYQANHLRPIDSLKRLEGLSLNIMVYFQNPDEILFNRDDDLFIERLKKANAQGITSVIIGQDGSHNDIHLSLWHFYRQTMSYR
jgi:hypothetical protein